MTEVAEGTAVEVDENGTELAEVEPQTVFRTDDPVEVMERTAEVANGLKKFITDQGLSKRIGQSDHIMVEGWQMLGMMLGCTAVVTETARVEHGGGGWEAVAELRDRTGRVIGAGEGECLKSEKTWKSRDDYALRSMAQTRAIGKAFRSVFGFIAKAAGYAPAPVEEMPDEATPKQDDARDPDDLISTEQKLEASTAFKEGPRTNGQLASWLTKHDISADPDNLADGVAQVRAEDVDDLIAWCRDA